MWITLSCSLSNEHDTCTSLWWPSPLKHSISNLQFVNGASFLLCSMWCLCDVSMWCGDVAMWCGDVAMWFGNVKQHLGSFLLHGGVFFFYMNSQNSRNWENNEISFIFNLTCKYLLRKKKMTQLLFACLHAFHDLPVILMKNLHLDLNEIDTINNRFIRLLATMLYY